MTKRKGKRHAMLPKDDGTVRGVEEGQFTAKDRARLRAACLVERLLPQAPDAAHQDPTPLDLGRANLSVHDVDLPIGEPGYRRVRIEPLPGNSQIHQVILPIGLIRVRHDLALALQQPIRRNKLRLGELKAAQERELHRKLKEKYGERAQGMTVEAVFAHIPPESAKTARLSKDSASLEFSFPADVSPRSAAAGHYLVVLRGRRNRTWKVLFRL